MGRQQWRSRYNDNNNDYNNDLNNDNNNNNAGAAAPLDGSRESGGRHRPQPQTAVQWSESAALSATADPLRLAPYYYSYYYDSTAISSGPYARSGASH